ncbi:MAG: hypothetical protein LUF84_03480 [Clostridiales bacterium]|nr:hypothetical protein [Clostridiales bacterium]
MNQSFTTEEKRRFRLKKHLKDHLFEYVLDILGPMAFAAVLLYLCEAERFAYGILLGLAWGVGRVAYRLYHYKKEYIDINVT